MIEKKLSITDEITLAYEEERLSKMKARNLFNNEFEVETFKGIA